jgi:hypothetical protein
MAAPVWQAFMLDALKDTPPRDFEAKTRPVPTTTAVPKSNTALLEPVVATASDSTMPALVGGNTDEAAAKARKAGLVLRRVDVQGPAGTPPGSVLAQSPAAGSVIRRGASVTIEATAGNPPPTVPVPSIIGQDGNAAVTGLREAGFTVTVTVESAPPTLLLPDGLAPASAMVWAVSPEPGQMSPDGKVSVKVQP